MTRVSRVTMAVAQMRPEPGNVQKNLEHILSYMAQAKAAGAELIFFPELAVTGYVLGDRWENDVFIQDIELANERIRVESDGLIVIWGSVKADWSAIGEDGRTRKYNAAFIAQDGRYVSHDMLDGWVPKTNLPKYRIFDDARHFYPADKLAHERGVTLEVLLQPFRVHTKEAILSLALTICEDLWEDEYHDKLSQIYGSQSVDLMVDISASPWTEGKYRARDRMLQNRVRDSGLPILYVNRVGLENNVKNLIWFDGDSALIGRDGEFKWKAGQHTEGLYVFEYASHMPSLEKGRHVSGSGEIFSALIPAMREFLGVFPKVVIGLSGGIDSAVSAALLVEALGKEKVLAVNMPSRFNSATTKGLAAECARNLGIEYRVVPIQTLVDTTVSMLTELGFGPLDTVTLENIQARHRCATIQAALAQKYRGVFINNGNKTEMALNYFTLYGDGAGVASFLGDIWKGSVYDLARYINRRAGTDLIPQGIIDVLPSAELSADQNIDEGKGDPIFYPYHDKLLLAFTETRLDPATIMRYAVDGNDVLEEKLGCAHGTLARYFPTRSLFVQNLEWAWRQYHIEWKRAQTPPVFITSRRAFGFDRRDTIANAYLTHEYQALKRMYLRSGA